MEDWHYCEALKRCRSFLVEEYTIESDIEKLANHLHTDGHITDDERKVIDETTLPTDKIQRLVDILISKCQSKAHSLYEFLIRELNKHGRKDVATKLLLTLKTVKNLPKPKEDGPEMAGKIPSENVSMSEIHRCLTKVAEYVLPACHTAHIALAVPVSTDLQTKKEPYSRLVAACGRGDVATVKQVLSDRPECINTVNDKGETVLMEACRSGTVSIVKALLMADLVDVNVQDINGLTAIMTSISRGDVDIVSAMLDCNKVDLSIRDDSGLWYLWYIFGEEMVQYLSALVHMGTYNADVMHKWNVLEVDLSMFIAKLKTVKDNLDWGNINKVVQTLLSKSNVNHTDLLTTVITLGNPDVLLPILQSGKVTTDKDIQDYSYVCVTSVNPGIVKVLLDFRLVNLADLTVVQVEAMVESIIQHNSRDLCASLSKLIHGLNLEVIKAMKITLLLQSMSADLLTVVIDAIKYNLNTKDTSGNSVFGLLCKYGSCATVSELLDRTDIDFDVKNNNGQSCLILALMNSDKNVPQLLMRVEKVRENVNQFDSYNTSTFAYACVSDNEDMVKILLDYKTLDVDTRDDSYYKPITYTCGAGAHATRRIGFLLTLRQIKILRRITSLNTGIRCNNSKIAAILLDCDRIDNTQKDQSSQTLVHYGCIGGNDETLSQILQTKAVSVNTQSVMGKTPLHMACNMGNVKSVNHLLNANARVNLKSPDNQSPIVTACTYGDTDIVKLLISKNANFSKTLKLACFYNHTDVVELLLTKNVDVNEEDIDGRTPLMVSCKWENAKVVHLLLNKNAIVDKEDREGCTALMIACQSGNVKIVQLLLKKNANVEKTNEDGNTPLIYAIYNNHPRIVEILLTKKANVNVCAGELHEPALLLACRSKNAKTVSLLLNANCNVNVGNSSGYTPLMHICHEGDVDILQMLLAKRVDMNMTSQGSMTALSFACTKQNEKIVELLLKNGAEVNVPNELFSPIAQACLCEPININIVDQVLSKGANVDQVFFCFTPLLMACEYGNTELVSLLIDYNANINLGCKKFKSITPLMQACKFGHTDTVTQLLSENADINATSSRGNTLLIYACHHENVDVVAQLIIRKVEVNHANVRGVTALMTACYRRNHTIVDLLMIANASVNIADAKGCTPLMWASHSGSVENIAALIGRNAAVNARDRRGGTALMRACKFGNDDVVKEILKADGVEINAITRRGNTALMFACDAGNTNAVSLLLEKNVDISVINGARQTALGIAKGLGHEDIVTLLTNHIQ